MGGRFGNGIVSYQVVQEWFNVVLRKAAVRLKPDEAIPLYRTLIEPLWRKDGRTIAGVRSQNPFA